MLANCAVRAFSRLATCDQAAAEGGRHATAQRGLVLVLDGAALHGRRA